VSRPSSAPRAGPRPGETAVVRRPVAVLLSRFPLITETFILREVIELERQGQPVVLVPLLREEPEVVHAEAVPWVGRALYSPFLSREIVWANVKTLARRPGRYLSALRRVLVPALRDPRVLAGTLGIFPKSVYLAGRLREEGVRHLHAHFATHPATAALIISELNGARFSFTAHAHDIYVGWRRAALGEKIRRAAFVRVISQFGVDHLRELYGEEAACKMRVIHVGVDPTTYAPRDEDRGPDGVLRMLSVAALQPYKGLPVLIEACRRLREAGLPFQCDMVGRGPMRDELQEKIDAAGLQDHVRLLGPLPQDEVARLMRRADLFVLPSIVAADGQMEGIPVVLMEAMASGRPVVASAISGIPELVEDGENGLLVPPGEPGGLARAVERLAADPALAHRLGEAGRGRVMEAFDLQGCTAELLEQIRRHDEPLSGRLEDLFSRTTSPLLLNGPVRVRRVWERQDSVVAELRVPDNGGERGLIYKLQRPRPGESRPARERARREHEILTRLHGALNGGPVTGGVRPGVPRPLHLDEEAGAVLMEPCRGMPLDWWIRRGRTALREGPRQDLETALHGAGVWLRRFQQSTPSPGGDAHEALEALVARAWGAVRACKGLGLEEGTAGGILERMERLREWVREDTLRVCGRHGDFWPGNVFVEPASGSVEVIDFEGWGEGLPWEDAARFLVHLETYFSWPLLGRRYRRASSQFLRGYVNDNGGMDPAALALCRMAAALDLLAGAATSSRGSLRSGRRTRTLLRICRQG